MIFSPDEEISQPPSGGALKKNRYFSLGSEFTFLIANVISLCVIVFVHGVDFEIVKKWALLLSMVL